MLLLIKTRIFPVPYFLNCPFFLLLFLKTRILSCPIFFKLVLIFCSSWSKLGWILSVWCGVGQLCLWGTFAESHRNQQHKKVFKTSHRRIGNKNETKWQCRSIKSPLSSFNQTQKLYVVQKHWGTHSTVSTLQYHDKIF